MSTTQPSKNAKRQRAAANPLSQPHPVLDHSKKLRAAATQMGWQCLDTVWGGWHVRHRFVCRRGHELLAVPSAVLRLTTSCEHCRGEDMLQRLHQAAKRDGVTCLEMKWKGVETQHRFRCSQGHEWLRAPKRGMNQPGCLQCPTCVKVAADARRLLVDGLLRLQRVAAGKGGLCLSDAYLGSAHRYRFRCGQGHEWDAAGGEVARGAWCRRCASAEKRLAYRLPDGLQRLQAAAAAKGGTCESEAYLGGMHQYRFRCAAGHEWETSGARALRGAWCRACNLEKLRLGIEAARQAAHARGGQCLSTTYTNTLTKLTWVCDRGHQWQTTLGIVRNGHWCPECAHAAQIRNGQSRARPRYGSSPRHSSSAT
ncbi:hypothetical protein OOT46_22895 [Aquabacterium sp. A7-Y]|uniref:hypothetical protein n=1 Tax=Aquabacterium sp. A7-Y TaxID=1349605 RepID=UPI00223CD720|nr:hypothetical protein [Aquabacterium sp. A7-Y]MCW7540671.1 hypothetical protein [Aquabacterium sp. A7-Y]